MFLTIYAAGMPFNGSTIPNGKSLGGSESAAYYMAKELAKLGHTITVFTSLDETGIWNNVRYEWIGRVSEQYPLGDRFHYASQAPVDVTIFQRHPLSFTYPINSKLNIWWLHDLAMGRNIPHIQRSLLNIDSIFTVSEFHKKQVAETWGIDPDFIYATKNGMEYDNFRPSLLFEDRKQKTLLFASRPERGLENVIRLAAMMPDYKFLVCSYDNTVEQMRGYYAQLFQACDIAPNIEALGHLGKEKLWQTMGEVMAIVYPTDFEDTSNMLALEAAAQGTPFIGPNIAALPETTSGGIASLIKIYQETTKPISRDWDDIIFDFKKQIESICTDQKTWEGLHHNCILKKQSWESIAKDWDNFFKDHLAEKSKGEFKSIKHFEQMSDIVALTHLIPMERIKKVLPDFEDNYKFLLKPNQYSLKEHYKRYYEYEAERGVVYGPESLDGNHRFEFVSNIIKRDKPRNVLDYGCAHGHYTINLAKRFPEIGFVGIDINEQNIKTAINWCTGEKLKNVVFSCCEFNELPEIKFDCILLGEILEHVPDAIELVRYLHNNHLANGGKIIITVPYGPWEAKGYNDHKGWRAHIHHFERADLLEVFVEMDNYAITSVPVNHELGSFVIQFNKTDDCPLGQIDYQRKLDQIAPRETISLCMIVKDAEDTIGKCLKNIAPWVDEIIIGLDNMTSDNTELLLMHLARQFPIKVFSQDSPLEIGFDEARNKTIAHASMDWILWLDDDENLENPHHLWKYLRNNHYKGYMIPQHHFSCEPAELLQTDLPIRIFRNRSNIKFFGVVHEHPSDTDDMNAGPGQVYKIEDLSISHLGYATETKRRKRFKRNYPLMIRDREKYPERILGQYLYIRDLCHDARYRTEINQGRVDEMTVALSREVIRLYEDLLNNKECFSRYLLMGLPYYSDSVRLVSNGSGVPYKFSINDIQVEGIFSSGDIALQLLNKVGEEPLIPFSKRYF